MAKPRMSNPQTRFAIVAGANIFTDCIVVNRESSIVNRESSIVNRQS